MKAEEGPMHHQILPIPRKPYALNWMGEPGVGKSRLFHELTHSHRAVGCRILQASAASYGRATAYLPVIPGQRVQKVLSRWCGVLWRRLFSDRDSLDVIERGGNHDLHPRAPGSVHSEGGAVDGGRPGLNEPQLIRALTRKRRKPADGEVPASIHGHEETGARFRLPCSDQDHDAARTARQRLDLRSRRRPRRAARELALERDVPDQKRR